MDVDFIIGRCWFIKFLIMLILNIDNSDYLVEMN